MKIKRFLAADIRTALQQVKESLGPDAVILSNRKTDEGVEIVAAMDFELEALTEKREVRKPASREAVPPPSASQVTPRPAFSARGYGAVAGMAEQPAKKRSIPPRGTAKPRFDGQATNAGAGFGPDPDPPPPRKVCRLAPSDPVSRAEARRETPPNQDALIPLRQELQQMRRLLDRHLSRTAWQQEMQTHPTRLDLMRALGERGFSRRLALELAQRGGVEEAFEDAWKQVRQVLTSQLPVVDDPLLDHGGVVALVGPTGVGKTTTIAKLAARFRLRHGPRRIALVTTDNYRIAAHEQLSTYARILGVPVRVAANPDELHAILRSFSDKQLVLIDTAGMSQRDARLAKQFSLLGDSEIAIETCLVLSAASQLPSLYEAMDAYAEFRPKAAIVTKLDEAGCLGPILSALVERGLPAAFMTDGQQVPEDLHPACAETLVARGLGGDAPSPLQGTMDQDFEDWMHYANVSS